jgi:hypothetical protein
VTRIQFVPRRAIALGAAALLAAGLAGCSVIGDLANQTSRDASGAVTESNDDADVFDVAVGDCIDSAALTGEVTTVPQIPCTEPHDSEAFHSLDLEDGDYPGESEVTSVASDECTGDAYEAYVGVAYEESLLQATYLYPTTSSWAQGDREILCLVYDPEGPTTGSLEGTAR